MQLFSYYVMFTLFIFVSVLAVLVLSHEFGHFIVARKNGIRVEEFGFGFPPRVCGVRRYKVDGKTRWEWVWGHPKTEHDSLEKPTLYSFNIIPLGGFVRIKGENAAESGAHDTDSFTTKKTWQKSAVLVAGVGMNILVAAILLSVGYMVGMPQEVTPGKVLQNPHVEIVQVMPDMPAGKAGLLPGDTLSHPDGTLFTTVTAFQEYVQANAYVALEIVVIRDGVAILHNVQPTVLAETGKKGIGVALAEVGLAKYPWYQAIYYGCIGTFLYLKEIIFAFFLLFKGLFTGAGVGDTVSGPVGVAVLTGQVARMGVIYLLQFTAMLSLNLAVLNILPIPALDGGRLFFVLLSKVLRRPITPRIEQTIHAVGFLLLMLLVVVVTVKDIGTFKGLFITWWQNI